MFGTPANADELHPPAAIGPDVAASFDGAGAGAGELDEPLLLPLPLLDDEGAVGRSTFSLWEN